MVPILEAVIYAILVASQIVLVGYTLVYLIRVILEVLKGDD